MKKIWESPVLETIGINMTEQGQNSDGVDGFFKDSKGALLLGVGSGPNTDDPIEGIVVGPITPVEP